MDNLVYKRLFETINTHIQSQPYETIADDFFKGVILEVMANSGKRVRSVMCCMANEMFSPLQEDTLEVAFAIELFHNFTLIHDDIMDEAPMRRYKPSLYGLYGRDIAILIGDVVLIEAYDVINRIKHPQKEQINTFFNQTAKDICIGQLYDLNQETSKSIWNLERYLCMIQLKTAVLMGRSLHLGALIGGASSEVALQLYDIGIDLGIVFQIHDDYLDVFGETGKVGKQKGGDILQKKKTILYFKAHEKLDEQGKKQLTFLMDNYDGEDKVNKMIALYDQIDLQHEVQQIEHTYMQSLHQKIDQLPCTAVAKEELRLFSHDLLQRKS